MRWAEVLATQEDQRNGNGNQGRDLPDELRRYQDHLVRIRQARKEMEAETNRCGSGQSRERESNRSRRTDPFGAAGS